MAMDVVGEFDGAHGESSGTGSSSEDLTGLASLLDRDIQSAGQLRNRASRCQFKACQCVPEHRQEHMKPDTHSALRHSEGASMHRLEGILLRVGQHEKQPILTSGQETVLVSGVAPGCARQPLHRHSVIWA